MPPPDDDYAPGWGEDAVSMMATRSDDRARFADPYLRRGLELLAPCSSICGTRAALAEFARVLRRGGHVALCSSDWSGAFISPRDDCVNDALDAHFQLRRLAGGDPFAGLKLPRILEAAGWSVIEVHETYRPDISYEELPRYIGTRIEEERQRGRGELDVLERGIAGCRRWALGGRGTFRQLWVSMIAPPPPSSVLS